MAEPAIAVLAAGLSTRFGGNKLEAACVGKPLGRWVLDAAEEAGLGPGMVIAGLEGASFAGHWRVLVNPAPEAGLGTSLALAARTALDEGAEALLILLADMPLVAPAYLRALSQAPLPAATRHPDGRPGVPALLDRALLEQAAALTGDRGAGPLLAAATLLDPPPGMLRDVDTAEDLAAIEAALRK